MYVVEFVVKPENNKNGRKNKGAISRARVLFVMIVPSIKPNIEALVVITIAPPTNYLTARKVSINTRIESSNVINNRNEKH